MKHSSLKNIYGQDALKSDVWSPVNLTSPGATHSIDAEFLYRLNVTSTGTITKHDTSWAESGIANSIQHQLLLIDIGPQGALQAGVGVNFVDALEPGFNMCVIRCINNGVLDIFRIPE